MPDPSPSWSLHKTPNPSERSFSVTAYNPQIAENKAALDAFLTGMPFADFPIIPEQWLAEADQYGGYLYTDCDELGPATMMFRFARALATDDNGNTAQPKPFRSYWKKFGNHRWCPLLKGLAFIEDPNFPLATNYVADGESGVATAPRNYVRELYIAEVNEGSRFLLDEFTSPVPFNMGRTPVPQPGRVSYQINGLSGVFEEALHDDIDIPTTRSTTVTYLGTTEGAADSRLPGQFFPRTNFRRRRPYILTMDQDLVNGVWYMQRLRVFPPRQPRLTTQ